MTFDISSAKSKSSRRDAIAHWIPLKMLYAVWLTQSITRRKRTRDIIQPWLTPAVTGKDSVRVPPWMTWHEKLSYKYNCWINEMILGGMLQWANNSQSTSWSILSKAFWKSIQFIFTDVCRSIDRFIVVLKVAIWSTQERYFLDSACPSLIYLSTSSFIRCIG